MGATYTQRASGCASGGRTVTIDLRALMERHASSSGGEGVTVTEICEATGVSVGKAREAVRAALRKGECRASRKTIVAMDGRVTSVPSYVFEGVAP